jgi:hypothetical protein
MTVNKHGALFWTTALAGLGALDYVWDQKHCGMTLSEFARWLFHTDTTPGKIAFTGALAAGSYVLHQHITKPVAHAVEEALA